MSYDGFGSNVISNSLKSLKIPKGQSESVYRRRKSKEGQAAIYNPYI